MERISFNLKKELIIDGKESLIYSNYFQMLFKAEEELFTTVGFEIVQHDMHIESKSDQVADLAKIDNGGLIRTVTLVSGDYSKKLRLTLTIVKE